MRLYKTLAVLVAMFACALGAQSATAADLKTLAKPDQLSAELKQRVLAAGPEGVQVAQEELNIWCPGYQARGVSANGCIVSPAGCTANFIFSDGTDWRTNPYIGTASHCVDKIGEPVIMQVDTTTLAVVGTVYKQTTAEDPGDDFALIKVDPAVAQKWGVNPAIPTGGPQGIYTGCSPQVIKNWGHGYGVAVAQGKPEVGVANTWYSDGYGWQGVGLPGDSGSGITLLDNRSAGDFTHIIILDPSLAYTPGQLVGMRTTRILEFLGASFSQVNADGTLSRATNAPCPSSGR
ncbi:MAG TPA: hypothetical protein VGW75_08985 [Solirubrobacteraceae bacterium]|jgi:hypothetical protein|nr:hypothetical protein [Solirubrobacteraceae bacterium]